MARSFASTRLAPWLGVAGIYGLVTVLMIRPFVDLRTLGEATLPGDGRLIVWTIAWIGHAISNGLPLFDANMYFPSGSALAYTEHMMTLGVMGWPIYLLTGNPVTVFSTLWLAAFWANGMGAHALAFRLTGRHCAAFAAGLIFGWSYFRVLHLGHLQLQWTVWMPIGLLLLERWHRTASLRWLLAATAASLAQMLTSWYLAVLTVILNAAWLAWLMWRDRQPLRPRVFQVAVCAALGALVLVPVIQPYLRSLTPGPVAESVNSSTDLWAYVMPPENTAAGLLLARYAGVPGESIWGERAVFIGWIAVLLAGCAFAIRPTDASAARTGGTPHRTFFALLGLLGLALALGPSGHGLAPFDLLTRLPGLGLFRAPARFALLVLLAVAMLAAVGAARLFRLCEARWGVAAARIAAAVVCVVMLAEWYPVGANVPRAEVKRPPEIYQLLESLPPGAIVSLPDYRLRPQWFSRADYLLYASFHWRPIVNGYGRSEPREYLSIVEQLSTFPAPQSVELARALGVRYFVIHSAEMEEGQNVVEAIDPATFRLLAHRGPDYLFEVNEAQDP